MTIEKPEDLILPSSQDDEVQLEEVTEVIPNITEPLTIPEAPVEEAIAEEQAENQEVSNLAADQPADTDLEMKAIEEELMTEDGVPIAPAFELDNVEKTGVEEPDDADIFVRNVDEEDDGSEKTLEQVNKRWTKRTQETLRMLSIGLHKSHPISFNDLVKKALWPGVL